MKEIEARKQYQFKDIALMSETARNRLFDYLLIVKIECEWPDRNNEYLEGEIAYPLALVGEEKIGIPYFANDIEAVCFDEESEAVLCRLNLGEEDHVILKPGDELAIRFDFVGSHDKEDDLRVGNLTLYLEKHSFYFSSVDGILKIHEEIKDVQEDAVLAEKDFELEGISEQDSQTHMASEYSGFSYFPWVIDENRHFLLLGASKEKKGQTLFTYFPLWMGRHLEYTQRKTKKENGRVFQLTVSIDLIAKKN